MLSQTTHFIFESLIPYELLRLHPRQPHSMHAQIGALGETRQPPIAYLLSSKSLSGIPYRILRRPVSLSKDGQLSFISRMLEKRTDRS